MNSEFSTFKLGEVADIIAGGDKPKIFSVNKSNLKNVPVFANAEKNCGLLGYTDSPRIVESAVTVAARGSNVGFVAVRKEPFFPVVRLLTLIPRRERLDVDYLFYNLKQNRQNGTGSGQPQITIPDISNRVISLPSIVTQQKVAKVLYTLDAKIEINNRINAELEAMAKTLYDYWFVQFDFPDANGKPYKTSGGKMVYNAELKREIPEGWVVKQLSEIANITMGQSPDGETYNEDGQGMIFFQGSTDFGWLFPTIRKYTTAPARMAKKGDILLSVRAPVGDMNLANNDCCIGRGLAALNSKSGYDGFLFYVMKYFKQVFDRRNTEGTTFGSITKDDLHSLNLAYPDDALLKRYDEVVSNYNDMILKRSLENQQLISLRDWLIPMLMNGQVTVK